MDQLVQQITARLCRKLNEEQPYYTPADLAEAGFPDFLISRIRLELERNLRESIVPPESDWASMSALDVRQAWGLFLDAINSEVRLPKSFARGVVESAVADLIDLLSAPRTHFPAYLFGNDENLTAEEVNSRMRLMVVYPHLGLFLPRYMKKRSLSSVSAAQYGRLLTQLDERVCRGYSPLNWVQLLEPLFVLCGGEVEGELLARFFREKGLSQHARRLRDQPDPLDTQQLVEWLTRPVYNYDEPADDSPETADKSGIADKLANQPRKAAAFSEPLPEINVSEPIKAADNRGPVPGSIAAAAFAKSAAKPQPEKPAPAPEPKQETPETADEHRSKPEARRDEAPAEVTQKIQSIPAAEEPEAEAPEPAGEDPAEVPLYRRYASAQDDDEDENTDAPAEPTGFTLADMEADEEPETDEQEEAHTLPRLSIFDDPDDDEDDETEAGNEDDDEPFVPLWQRLRIDNEDSLPDSTFNYAGTEANEDELQPAADNARFEQLYEFLKDDEARFLKEIFEGDRRAYIGALERISGFDNWREAGKYLTNEIFRRYEVDMYKDVSIDFTDCLHKFFKNYA